MKKSNLITGPGYDMMVEAGFRESELSSGTCGTVWGCESWERKGAKTGALFITIHSGKQASADNQCVSVSSGYVNSLLSGTDIIAIATRLQELRREGE